MKARSKYFVLSFIGSSVLLSLFQNCSKQKFQSGQMLSVISSSNTLRYVTDEAVPLKDTLPRAGSYTGTATTVVITSSPNKGKIQITNAQTGEFIYTPNTSPDGNNAIGEDSFEYSEEGNSNNLVKNKKAYILINPVNGKAYLNTDLINTDMNQAKSFNLTVTNKYTVPTVLLDSVGRQSIRTTNGLLTMTSPNNFTYTPNAYFRGSDSYEFRVFMTQRWFSQKLDQHL